MIGRAVARAALVGNPSDGYGGRVLAVAVPQMAAEVTLGPGAPRARTVGADLVDAALVALDRHGDRQGWAPVARPHCDGVSTTIPPMVGLGGSSAIVIATLRAALAGLDRHVAPEALASIALAAEVDVLGLPAGLQDRVVQSLGGLVYMDFTATRRYEGWTGGAYERLDPVSLPPLFVAWVAAPESSAVVHADLRDRHDRGEAAVVDAMVSLAELALWARDAVAEGRGDELGPLMSASLAVRRSVVPMRAEHVALVDAARSVRGVHVNSAGSGGAVVGTYPSDTALDDVAEAVGAAGGKLMPLRGLTGGGAVRRRRLG